MIVDFHTHIFPPWLRAERERYLALDFTFGALFADPKAKMATAEELVAHMEESGVDLSVILGIGWTDQGLASACNDYLLESAARYPGRLIPFCCVNPAWGRKAVGEAERCAAAGARGIGELHPDTQGFDLGVQATMGPLLDLARQRGLVLLTHTSEPLGHQYPGKGRTVPQVVYRFIELARDVDIVCAHWGGGLPFYALMPAVAQALARVYFDSAASPFLYRREVFRRVACLVGPEKVLLGSDYPLLTQSRLLHQVQRAGLAPEAQALVLGENARRLLGLPEPDR